MHARINVDSPLGRLSITSANPKYLIARSWEDRNQHKPIEINGVPYQVTLNLQNVNGWNLQGEDSYHQYHALHMSRTDKFMREATEAARRKVLAVLLPFVQQWAADNPEFFDEARRLHQIRETERLQEGIRKLEAQLQEKRDELGAL